MSDKITCECGSKISNNEQAIYIHTHGVCHRYKTGMITKEQYDDYRNAQKAKYSSEENAEKTQAHREKMRGVMREKNAKTFEKAREEQVFCADCQCSINKTALYMHRKSLKHQYAMQGLKKPYKPHAKKIVEEIEL